MSRSGGNYTSSIVCWHNTLSLSTCLSPNRSRTEKWNSQFLGQVKITNNTAYITTKAVRQSDQNNANKQPTFCTFVEVKQWNQRVFGVPCHKNSLHIIFINPPAKETIWQMCLVSSRWGDSIKLGDLRKRFLISTYIQIENSVIELDFLHVFIILFTGQHQRNNLAQPCGSWRMTKS